MSDEVIHD